MDASLARKLAHVPWPRVALGLGQLEPESGLLAGLLARAPGHCCSAQETRCRSRWREGTLRLDRLPAGRAQSLRPGTCSHGPGAGRGTEATSCAWLLGRTARTVAGTAEQWAPSLLATPSKLCRRFPMGLGVRGRAGGDEVWMMHAPVPGAGEDAPLSVSSPFLG